MAGFTPEQEQLLRNAIAEYVTRVQPCPALHLIRMRTAAPVKPGTAADTPASHPYERNES